MEPSKGRVTVVFVLYFPCTINGGRDSLQRWCSTNCGAIDGKYLTSIVNWQLRIFMTHFAFCFALLQLYILRTYSKALVRANKPVLVASPLSNLWKILSSTSGGNSIWVIFQIYIQCEFDQEKKNICKYHLQLKGWNSKHKHNIL